MLVDLFELEPGLLSHPDGLVLVLDKGFTTERWLAERGLTMVARPTRGEKPAPPNTATQACVRPSASQTTPSKGEPG
ncbi:hypothetical protein [Phytohabitans houttuyneae]|uniref:Uncharacterized protein n=1 Tax=Phytohabitans houttuyneae TaxID=1076126 RepID=A0A6V8K5R9_9ACTN|nr:hypothetical protein [Phytohabitans houttuyneae]GFJ79104.1 hypothetical protein Phou_032840 [Phytohabitans houttuyneae]